MDDKGKNDAKTTVMANNQYHNSMPATYNRLSDGMLKSVYVL